MAFMTEQSEQKPEAKQNQTTKIILLLILLGAFGYLYFFTPLIRTPEGEEVKKEAPPVSQMVKKPLPQKEGASRDGKPAPAPADEKQPAQKPAQPPATAKVDEKKSPPAVPQKPAPPASPKKEEPVAKSVPPAPPKGKPAPVPPNPAAAPAVAKNEPQKVAQGRTAPSPAPAAKKSSPAEAGVVNRGKFTLSFGEVPEGAVMNDLKKRLAAAGITPVTTRPVTRKVTMHRLLVSEQTDHDTALREVASLRKRKIDAFMGETGERYRVYAGSYLYRDRADEEIKRLASLGVSATIVDGEAEVRLQSVTAGSFGDRESAEKAKKSIALKGAAATVVERK